MATNKDFIVKNGLSVGEDISVSGSVTSNLQFDDDVQIQLGTDSDLLIYHDNSNAYIDDVGAGSLYIRSGTTYFQNAAGTKTSIQTNSGAGQTLYFNNDPIFATLVDGVSVTGNAVLTGELRGPASFVIDPTTVGDNTGEVVIKGDLTVQGTTTTINSTQLDVADKNITLNFGAGDTSLTANNAGITIQDAIDASTDATILWNKLDESFDFSHAIKAGNFSRIGEPGRESVFRHSTTNNSAVIVSGSGNMEIRGQLSDTYQIFAQSGGNVGIGKIPATGIKLDVAGDITSSGTITGSDFSGITMGGSLSGSHDDAKVQYGTTFSGTPAQGHFFFDSLNQKLKVYTGSAFVDAVPAGGGGGGGSGSSDATATFRKYTYTLASSTNAVSGKEDDEVTTTNFISGRKYEITAVGNTDFTAIGASSNAIGVVFVATDVGGGTTGKAKEVLFYATGGTQNIEVYVNGVKAVEGSSNDYVATTGTSVTFTSNLAIGDVVDVQVYELLTNDSYYLKSETYTQAQTIAGFVAKSGDTMTGNLAVEKSANPTFTVTETNAGAVTIQGTGSGGRVYSNSGNKLLIGANGQNSHLNIDTAGKVGIGDPNPSFILDVNNTSSRIRFKATTGDSNVELSAIAGRDYVLQSLANGKFRIYDEDDSAERLTIDTAGYVGIGTDDPDQKLHVDGATKSKNLYLTNVSSASQSDAFIYWSDGSGTSELTFDANSTSDSNIKFNTSEPAGSGRTAMWLQGDDWEDGGQSTTVYGRLKVVDGYGAKAGIETTQVRHNERPLLLLDFANSKRLDPRILFIRGTTGTYWDGKTAVKAEENLIPRSDFSSGWETEGTVTVNLNNATAPDGTTTALKINQTSGGSAYYYDYVAIAHTGKLTGSVYLKQGTQKYAYVQLISGNTNHRQSILWDLNTGTQIGSDTNGSPTGVSHSITSIGDGWYRCTVTMDQHASGNGYLLIGMADSASPSWSSASTAAISGNTSEHIYIWGPQLENRDSVGTYTPTYSEAVIKYQPALQTTGTTGVARFDHNPVTKECEGLLVENYSTNLYTHSSAPFAGATGNCKLLTNVATAPDGTQTADAVISNGASSSGYAYRSFSSLIGNGTFTVSGYIKRVRGTSSILFGVGSGASGNLHLVVSGSGDSMSVSASVSGSMVGSHATVKSVGNGWYRVSATGTTSSASGYTEFQGMPIGANTEWLIWGVQVEATTFPTSYIATSGSTVTRSRDIAELRDMRSKDLLNPEEGTFYLEHKTARSDNTLQESFAGGIGLDSGNYLGVLYSSAGDTYLQPGHGSIANSGSMSPPVPPDGKWKSATLWKTESNGDTTARVSVNGVNSTDETTAVTTVFKHNADPDLTIGSADFSAGSKFGWTRKIAVYGTDIGTATANALTEV